jgi:hypothetical protein
VCCDKFKNKIYSNISMSDNAQKDVLDRFAFLGNETLRRGNLITSRWEHECE